MGVIERLSDRCREAFCCGTPILYVLTDSFETIQTLVRRDEMVVRLAGANAGNRFEGRPFRELPEEKQRQGPPANHLDQDLEALSGGVGRKPRYLQWNCPHILTFHVSGGALDESGLERYVKDYLDPLCPVYHVLRSSVILLYGSDIRLSPGLLNYTEVISVALPDREEICRVVEETVAGSGERIPDDAKRSYLLDISAAFSGFTREEIGRTMRRILARRDGTGRSPLDDSEGVFRIIREQKSQRILSSNVLRLTSTPPLTRGGEGDAFRQQGVGGLEHLTDWVKKRRTALLQADFVKRTRGADSPKGLLVCGIPGCGKSLAAKAVAAAFHLPLLQMDMGSLMDKYQGESERNMRRALELAEAMSPCVLWIDELEKGFSGAQSGQEGDNSFKRMFATMLNWMQENRKPCFIYATANDIGGLPKEFFRSGRFDALFAVYLPVCTECANIVVASMERAEKNAEEEACLFAAGCKDLRFLERLIDREMVRDGRPRVMIGADINKLVNDALMFCHDADCAYPIRPGDWETHLGRAMREGSVYGDGSENLDSIAVSYIRMLKKGFLTANLDALFRKEDYESDPRGGAHLRRMTEQQLRERWPHPYDQAVYHLLADRIDCLAEQVEAVEHSRLIGR